MMVYLLLVLLCLCLIQVAIDCTDCVAVGFIVEGKERGWKGGGE